MHCVVNGEQVLEGFLAAPPLISKNIYNLTIKQPRWISDLYQLEEFPLGQGTQMQQIIMRGQMPKIERGFAAWTKMNNNAGCDPCEGPNCSYNITQFGGTGIEKKLIEMMKRDFRSNTYCVDEIETTAHYEQIMALTVQNLYAQIAFFKEQNIGFNYLTGLAKKYVVDSNGPQANPQNPYVYRPKGTAILSGLNIELMESFYEYMRLLPDAVPYDNVNGQSLYAMECSPQLLARLYRDDPQLRQDVRFSGLSNDLVTKYNFISTIRDMFIPAPILYPRRFSYDSVAGTWNEILPFVNGIPMEIGAFTGLNLDYINPAVAEYEEVLFHGKWPFKIMFMPQAATLGSGTSFGPEYSFMNAWKWVNPQTVEDPDRREGFFFTNARIGLAPQYSESIFGILVKRPSAALAFSQLPLPVCPTTPAACDNTVPAVDCPCALVTDAFENPVTGDTILTLAVPLSPVPDPSDTIDFGIDTGGYLVGTVVAAAEDGLSVEVTFPNGTDLGVCDHFTTVFCDDTRGCSATVLAYEINCTDNTRLDLTLANAIKADASDTITIFYGDGTSATVTIISVNSSTLKYVVDVGGTAFCDQVGGVTSVCVPTATDASCPGCDGVTYTQCYT